MLRQKKRPRDIVIAVSKPKIREQLDQLYAALCLLTNNKITYKLDEKKPMDRQQQQQQQQLNHNGGKNSTTTFNSSTTTKLVVEMLRRMLSERMSGDVCGRLVRV